jgi:hypothetical protein
LGAIPDTSLSLSPAILTPCRRIRLSVANSLTDPTPARENNQDDNHEQINQAFRPATLPEVSEKPRTLRKTIK